MGADIRFVDQNVVLELPSQMGPDEVRARHAAFARQLLRDTIANDEGSGRFEKYIDGRKGAQEETVRYPNGEIRYEFAIMDMIAEDVLRWFQTYAPKDTGKYQDSFFVMIAGAAVDVSAIPVEAKTITITNPQRYSRKIQVGFKGYEAHAYLFDHAANYVRSMYDEVVVPSVATWADKLAFTNAMDE